MHKGVMVFPGIFVLFAVCSCGAGDIDDVGDSVSGDGDVVGDAVGDISGDANAPLACNPERGASTVNLLDVQSSDGFRFSGRATVTSLEAESEDDNGLAAVTVGFSPAEGDVFRLRISVPGDDLLPDFVPGGSYDVYFTEDLCGMWIEQNFELAVSEPDGGMLFWFMGRGDDAAGYGACGGQTPCPVFEKQAPTCTAAADQCGTFEVPNLRVTVDNGTPESVEISLGFADTAGGLKIGFVGGFDIVGDNECTDGPSSWIKLIAVKATN